MANKLKIYACSGIGDAAALAEKPVGYWTDGTNSFNNTQAVNSILAMMNSRYITVRRLRSISLEEKLTLLNDIDMLSVALAAARRFEDDPEALHRAGQVIGYMMERGDFESNQTTGRDLRVDELLSKFEEIYSDEQPVEESPSFMDWWKTTVEDRNKKGYNFGQQQAMRKALRKSKGSESWQDNEDLAIYLNDGGAYFLYTYFTPSQLRQLPKLFNEKKKVQEQTYDYCKSLYVGIYGSEEEMREVIRASIVDRFGDEPETVCADIVAGRKNVKDMGIGFCWETVVAAVLTTLLQLFFAFLTKVFTAKYQSESDKYAAIDLSAAQAASPNASDFDTANLSSKSSIGGGSGVSSWLPYVAAGLGIVMLLKTKKK